MSSIPAAKERPSGIDAAKEAVLAYATRLGNRSLYARQSVVVLAELSRLEEQVATLTRERDEAREQVIAYRQGCAEVFYALCPTCRGSAALPDKARDPAWLGRQRKEGGE